MKNVIICKSCHVENPYFGLICDNCKSYLRERVVNIDLWHTLGTLIETPVKAFSDIIHAEHKNFIFFLYFLFSLKFFLNALTMADPLFGSISIMNYSSIVFLISIFVPLIVIYLFSYIFTLVTRSFNVTTRVNDNFAVFIYSLIPHIIAMVFFFPVELVLFGSALFVSNPSPYLLKPTPAVVMAVLEVLMMLWSVILGYFAVKAATKSTVYSIIVTLLLNLILAGLLLGTIRIFSMKTL